jgi:hypothetical protein
VGRLGGTTWARRTGAPRPWLPKTYGMRFVDSGIRLAKGRGRGRREP